MAYGIQLFGYRRSKVDRRIKKLEESLKKAEDKVPELVSEIDRLRAENEELKSSMSAMRQQHLQLVSKRGTSEPSIIMVGPADFLKPITTLMDALESCPFFTPRFRIYRDGYYRVDGFVHDRLHLDTWLEMLPDVKSVTDDVETIYVLPKGISV